MRHLIVGCGTVGKATGFWLDANRENVTFYDVRRDIVEKLENNGYDTTRKGKYDMVWFCTMEQDLDKAISKNIKYGEIFIIRSTIRPGMTNELSKKYNIMHIAYIPEFLREKTHLLDIFNPSRVIVGTNDRVTKKTLEKLFIPHPIFFVDTIVSETVKLISNCWLSTQISFWNEIKRLCDNMSINPQQVADVCTLDKRISRYGSMMLGEPFQGKCLPKDLDATINIYKQNNLSPILLEAVKKINERLV